MLCQQCQEAVTTANTDWELTRINTNNSREVTIHKQHAGLESSADAGCLICRKVLHTILTSERLSQNSINSTTLQRNTNSALDMRVALSSHLHDTKIVTVGTSSEKYLESFLLVPRFGSADSAPKSLPNAHLLSTSQTDDLWRHWHDTCSETHSKCRVSNSYQLSAFMPKRLVEVLCDSDKKPQQWRIVLGADVERPDYLTLSHCWGFSKHLSLTKQNYHDLMAISPCSMLPATYRDALFVTTALGKRFIWIDSLCITQDDEDDWKSQSSVMGSIYKHSACNIAALWAEGSSDGCFAPKERPTFISLGSEEFSVQHFLYDAPFHQEDIMHAPLNKRSWVIQERYLALRQLGFAKSQVYWACQELTASEEFPAGMPYAPAEIRVGQASALSRGGLTSESDLALRKIWADLVKAYSRCQLTYLTDKTIALAGIAGEFRTANNDTYLAGLWRQNLEDQLCWSRDREEYPYQSHGMTPTYLAPTWSWINLHGPVEYDRVYARESVHTKLVEILEASVQSEDPNGLHSFVSSRLRVRGIALWGCLKGRAEDQLGLGGYLDRTSNWFTLNKALERPGKDPLRFPTVSIDWDECQLSLAKDSDHYQRLWQERTGQLLILPFSVNQGTYTHGLLLRRLDSTEDDATCVRLGIVHLDGIDFAEFLWERLELPRFFSGISHINLNNLSIESLVQEVTIQ
ncbi:heterokaryon incompatibility protein-domain-containing protein [Fusarium avenaceum]|nr:heterokaryon incompatibility protein-domain-containing protein [Fusarium avenaceum]